jgi:hypothetical protein
MIWIKFILYPLGDVCTVASYFYNYATLFNISKYATSLCRYNFIDHKLWDANSCCYKIPHLAPKYKFVVSTTYVILFTFLLAIYSTTVLLEGLKVAPQAIWLSYLFFHIIGVFIYFSNNRDEFCWDNLLK